MRICKRCHRLRAVNGAGYCPACADTLDGLRKRRRAPPEAPEEELAEASTDPAPPKPQEEPDTSVKAPELEESMPDTPRAESLASEPPASGVKS